MNLRTYKQRRYATPEYGQWAPALASALAAIRKQRRELLKTERARRDLGRILAVSGPRTRKSLLKMLAADLDGMRQAGEWNDMVMFADFLSPYACRVLQARLARVAG
jgi:hypothetical protein